MYFVIEILSKVFYTTLASFRIMKASSSAVPVAETWRPVWWGAETVFADQDSSLMFFSEKVSIFRAKISHDLFFSHQPGFSDFPFLFPDFPYLYYVKCRIWPFPHKKNHYFRKEFLYGTFLLC